MEKTLKRHGQADTIVTDGLRSYPAAMRELGNVDRREMGQWLNNRCEQPPWIPPTKAGDAQISTDEDLANSPRPMPTSPIPSISNAISSIDKP